MFLSSKGLRCQYEDATMAKQRWRNREILELVSTEFRDRSIEYYVWNLRIYGRDVSHMSPQRYAIESGVCCVNGKPAKIGTIIKNGDRIENIVHRHEPPVTSIPVKVMKVDTEKELIVIDKPGSIVSPHGRFILPLMLSQASTCGWSVLQEQSHRDFANRLWV